MFLSACVDVRQPFKENNSILEAAQIGIQQHLDHQQVEISYRRDWMSHILVFDWQVLWKKKITAEECVWGWVFEPAFPAHSYMFQGIVVRNAAAAWPTSPGGGYLLGAVWLYLFRNQRLVSILRDSWANSSCDVCGFCTWKQAAGSLGWCFCIQLLLLQLGVEQWICWQRKYILIFGVNRSLGLYVYKSNVSWVGKDLQLAHQGQTQSPTTRSI